MTDKATNFNEAVALIVPDSNRLHDIVNGEADQVVTIEDGSTVPTVRKTLVDNFKFKNPIDWVQGGSETEFLQVRRFTDGTFWYAPNARVTAPIPMGVNPSVDSNWQLAPIAPADYLPKEWVVGGTSIKNQIYIYQPVDDQGNKTGSAIEVYDSVGGNVMGQQPDMSIFSVLGENRLSKYLHEPSSTAFVNFLQSSGYKIIDVDIELSESISAMVSDSQVTSTATISFSNSVTDVVNLLTITGSNNKWSGGKIIHNGTLQDVSRIAQFVGNKNRVEGVETSFLNEPASFNPSDENRGVAIVVTGDSNSVVGCSGDRLGTGVEHDGRNNFIQGNNYGKCIRLVYGTARSRHHIVDGNSCNSQNFGNGLIGADGITDNRSARFGRFTNNTVKGVANNGAYLQGDSWMWDKTNFVEDCGRGAVKVGAKPSDNFTYPGETLPTFDENGNPDQAGQYATTNAVLEIRGRNCNLNSDEDGFVTLQSNIADITIKTYDISDSPNSLRAIQGVYLEAEPSENQHVMANIKVLDGTVKGSGSIVLACKSGLFIDGIETDAVIQTQAKTGELCISPRIKVKSAKGILLTKSQFAQVLGGVVDYVDKSNSLQTRICDTSMLSQQEGSDFGSGRVEAIKRSLIRWSGVSEMNIDGVKFFQNNEVALPDFVGSYGVTYNFNSASPSSGQFSDNTISVPQSNRPVRVGGAVTSICGNNIEGAPTSDFTLTVQSDGSTVTGTTLNSGQVYLDANSSNCFVVAKAVSNIGSGNVVITS
ncbi:hypothetical protein NVP1084O_182 [Vibrio phage 1.084.O._10N.261.49.F5]|nr:hypothetical protein NVP1084O_182 [Vibrio phage 1.084.O._10N.261.49.F5]